MDHLPSRRGHGGKGIKGLPHDLPGDLWAHRGGSPTVGQVANAAETALIHENHQRHAAAAEPLGGYLCGEVFLKACSATGFFCG